MHATHTHTMCIGDASAASQLSEQEVDKRVRLLKWKTPKLYLILDHLILDKKTKYYCFWNEVEKFLQEDVGLAVEERRHSEITHMAKVISVRDLLQQVVARCPPTTPIPSRSWLALQFWPKNVHAQSQVHYTG